METTFGGEHDVVHVCTDVHLLVIQISLLTVCLRRGAFGNFFNRKNNMCEK